LSPSQRKDRFVRHRHGPPQSSVRSVPKSTHRRRRRHGDKLKVGICVVTAGIMASVGTFALADRDPEITLTSFAASADTYVVQQYPKSAYGRAPKLTAANWRNWRTEAYLRFTVPAQDDQIVSARVELTFERDDHRPTAVELRGLDADWSEATTFRTRPQLGAVVATATVTDADTVSFDVTSLVREEGVHEFALTNADPGSVASLHSREQGSTGPRLVIGTVPGGAEVPTAKPTAGAGKPTPTATARPTPTATAKPPTSPTTPQQPPPAAPAPSGSTLCGASFATEKSGESYQQALGRLDGLYNGLELVRIFYPGKPGNWPGKLNVDKRPIVVSFKFPPAEVASGKHDAFMRSWFAAAPRDQEIYWTYYHEPEQEIDGGQMTSAQYKAAWKRLRSLADEAGNDRLTATLILMGWSVNPKSGRNWRDYYPGRDVVQVLGWDIYNPPGQVSKGNYQSPAEIYERVIETSRAEDLPFGIGETGSYLTKGDSGSGRAAWLRSVAKHLSDEGAVFVAYFDHDWPSGDFRLRDQASIAAWREFCS
jgi:hypothetical protein